MTLTKISDLRLKFEQQIVLNPEKKYKLGVTHLLFSLNQTFNIKYLDIEFVVPVSGTHSITITINKINGNFTINSLQNEFRRLIKNGHNIFIENLIKEKKE